MTPDSLPSDTLLYRISTVMKMLDVARSTVYRMVERGELELIHFGPKASRITAESVRLLIERGRF